MKFITKRLNEITMEVSVNREGALIQPQCSPQFKRRDKEAEVAQETEKEQTREKAQGLKVAGAEPEEQHFLDRGQGSHAAGTSPGLVSVQRLAVHLFPQFCELCSLSLSLLSNCFQKFPVEIKVIQVIVLVYKQHYTWLLKP